MEQILEKDPHNALALYGRARSLDSLAEVERSNARLEQSIFAYRAVLDLEDQVDDHLYHKSALRCIDRMRFRGNLIFVLAITLTSLLFLSFIRQDSTEKL